MKMNISHSYTIILRHYMNSIIGLVSHEPEGFVINLANNFDFSIV